MMTEHHWFSKLWQIFSTKSHFTSSTSSLAKTWSLKVITFSSRTLKQFLSPNVVMLQFTLNWWTMALERYFVTQPYARIQTSLNSSLTLKTERNFGKTLRTFWMPVKKIKCSDIRFQDSSVMESTKRWVWWTQCKRHRKKSLSCFTNRNKTKMLRSMKNSTTHLSWQLVSTYQRETCRMNLRWTQTTKRTRPNNWKC